MSGYIEGRLEAKRIAQIGFDIASVFKVEIIGRQRGPEVTPFDSCRRLTMRKTDIATIAKLSIFQTIKDGAYVQTIGKLMVSDSTYNSWQNAREAHVRTP